MLGGNRHDRPPLSEARLGDLVQKGQGDLVVGVADLDQVRVDRLQALGYPDAQLLRPLFLRQIIFTRSSLEGGLSYLFSRRKAGMENPLTAEEILHP